MSAGEQCIVGDKTEGIGRNRSVPLPACCCCCCCSPVEPTGLGTYVGASADRLPFCPGFLLAAVLWLVSPDRFACVADENI